MWVINFHPAWMVYILLIRTVACCTFIVTLAYTQERVHINYSSLLETYNIIMILCSTLARVLADLTLWPALGETGMPKLVACLMVLVEFPAACERFMNDHIIGL